ncbi:hypothetical protein AURDEDRAFT_149194 [Auricularia subglabra TFB-10046 SS5]|nr:hypothetical protein AURDEDRAFT_149194 [Auricularia subglabra TFB-10046 SS5]
MGKLGGTGQFKTYMVTNGRYRPDLPTVYGILVNRKYIQLSQLNACGLWSSSPASLYHGKAYSMDEKPHDAATYIAPWIAFVYLVYQSYDQRDRKLSFNAQQDKFVRWDVIDTTGSSPKEKYALTPFYAAPAPGRRTFAAFQVTQSPLDVGGADDAYEHDDVTGFWKLSWQQDGRRSTEHELLDRIHGPGRWIPGLVRTYPLDEGERLVVPSPSDVVRKACAAEAAGDEEAAESDDDGEGDEEDDSNYERGDSSTPATGCRSTEDGPQSTCLPGLSEDEVDFVERIQEVLHIASIGEPLSQCETPREILYSAYDLLETYDHLWDEDIMHRDVSWFNVMVKPAHHTGRDTTAQERPCIRKLMHEAGHSDEQPLVSSVLLGDLDHAIDMKDPERDRKRRERTGTPMFISMDLAEFRSAPYSPPDDSLENVLVPKLRYLDSHPSLLRSAFPKGDGDFMASFEKVLSQEIWRRQTISFSQRPKHSPRHDGESIFWVYLWAFVRARPRGALPETGTELERSSAFCEDLLAHVIGENGAGPGASGRASYMQVPNTHLRELFHPSLVVFEEMFVAMAAYLRIPWHLHPDTVKPNHVQTAFRRIVFGFVHHLQCTKPALLDLALDTERPRPIIRNPGTSKGRKEASSDPSAGGTGRSSVGDELRKDDKPKKRKAAGPSGGRALKKRAGASKKPQLAQIPADAPSPNAAGGSTAANEIKIVKKYSHALHAHLRTAQALQLKVWKDRTLWFSKGG